MRRMPVPCWARVRRRSRRSCWAARSRALEGSSRRSMDEEATRARPIMMRRCSPADIWPAGFVGAGAHLRRDRGGEVWPECGAGEEAGKDGFASGGVEGGFAGEFGGDYAE